VLPGRCRLDVAAVVNVSLGCEIKFEEGCCAVAAAEEVSNKKKTFFEIQSEKVVDRRASQQECSVENLGRALLQPEEKSPIWVCLTL
jgi:hypothetical protein